MKFKNVKRMAAAALALTMCFPSVASASTINSAASGTFNSSFDLYAPTLTISVPLKLDILVNPVPNTDSSNKSVSKFSIASNSINIINASVDTNTAKGIPVNVMVSGLIKAKAADVITVYKDFTPTATDTTKKVFLQLSQANTAAAATAGSSGKVFLDNNTNKRLNLAEWTTSGGEYDSITNQAVITKNGALLSMDIGAPTGSNLTTAAANVIPTVGSFAVTGSANASADWKASDVTVEVKYVVKASATRSFTTPALTAVTGTGATTDVTLVNAISFGEATVNRLVVHYDALGEDKDIPAADCDLAVAADGKVTLKLKANSATLTALSKEPYKGKTLDLAIVLSDGRVVVTTLTIS